MTYFFLHKGIPTKLFNIKELKNDFNFMDIEADWVDQEFKVHHGKFYLKDLILR